MKRLMKSMVLMAAAALALASCAKENVNEPNNGTQKFAEVSFKAEIPTYQTTKSTIDVDDLTFKTRWAEGDQMGLSYSYGETDPKTEKENVPAKYSKDGSYTVNLPTKYTGTWEYYVYYPYQSDLTTAKSVEIPFGPERTQAGNAINSAYDIMHGLHGTKNSAAGKEEDGSSIHFDMERLTSLLHFHFTSSLNEKVLKATLSVEGDPIAADKYVMHVDMTNATTSYTTGSTSNEITLNISDATADDFSLWFNILPFEKGTRDEGLENMKLVVETETKTFSITNDKDIYIYEAGEIHSITAKVPDSAWKDKTTPTPPATKAYYEKVTTAPTDWSGDYLIVYEAGSVAFDGSLTTFDGTNNYQTVNITNERIEATTETDAISFEISSTEGGYYVKSTSGYYIGRDAASNGVDYSTTTKYLNTISSSCVISGKGQTTLQVYSVNGQKPQINFKYYKSKQNAIALYKRDINIDRKDVPSLGLSTDAASVIAAETSATFDILSNTDWTVTTDASWINGYDKGGKGNGTVTIQFDANTAATARTATFTVKTADNAISKTFTLTQKAFGAETKVTYDFTKINGFADWSTGYSEHAVNYTETIVTFKSANRNTSTIKDQPVTKGDDVSVVMTGTKKIKSVKLVCKQWGTKNQTITLNTSTDGGKNYTATSTQSSDFTLEATSLSDGINAVKFTFSTKNQVGISSLEITYAE